MRRGLLPIWKTILGAMPFYTALQEQGKPVELIYFPEGQHNLELPSERQASMQQVSMQQVVDWFRFWLQGYERSGVPDDPERFTRWRALREQQEWNEHLISEGRDPAQAFIDCRMATAPAQAAGE